MDQFPYVNVSRHFSEVKTAFQIRHTKLSGIVTLLTHFFIDVSSILIMKQTTLKSCLKRNQVSQLFFSVELIFLQTQQTLMSDVLTFVEKQKPIVRCLMLHLVFTASLLCDCIDNVFLFHQRILILSLHVITALNLDVITHHNA